MNVKKRATCYLLVGMMMLSVAACGPEEINTIPTSHTSLPETTIAPVVTAVHTADTVTSSDGSSLSTEGLLAGTPAHISKVYSESFSVEADVSVPAIEKADVLSAKLAPVDEEKLVSVLFGGQAPEKEISSADNAIIYRDERSYAYTTSGTIHYSTQEFEYVRFPTDSFKAASDLLSGNPEFGDAYVQERVGFMAPAEAIASSLDTLAQVTINSAHVTEVYAIDYQTMQRQQEERVQKANDYRKKQGLPLLEDPFDGYKSKETFTPDDDFYILCFAMAQNGIPVTRQPYRLQAGDRVMSGSNIRVSLSRNGVMEMFCDGIYQQQGIDESPDTLISADDALQAAYEKHNEIVATDKVNVTSIDFEYVPVPYNDHYDEVKLFPAWSLTTVREREMPAKDGSGASQINTMTTVVFINAITGETIK